MKACGDCNVDPIATDFDPKRTDISKLKAALLVVEGMGCPNCAIRARNGLLSLDGVLLARVNLKDAWASVAYEPDKVTLSQLLNAVSAAGGGRHRYYPSLIGVSSAAEQFQVLR